MTRANIGTIKGFKRYVYCIPTQCEYIYIYICKLYTTGNVVHSRHYQGEPYLVYARRSNEQGFLTRQRFEQLFQGMHNTTVFKLANDKETKDFPWMFIRYRLLSMENELSINKRE